MEGEGCARKLTVFEEAKFARKSQLQVEKKWKMLQVYIQNIRFVLFVYFYWWPDEVIFTPLTLFPQSPAGFKL